MEYWVIGFCEFSNLTTLNFSSLDLLHIFRYLGKIFCVKFRRIPLKFHTKYFSCTEIFDGYIIPFANLHDWAWHFVCSCYIASSILYVILASDFTGAFTRQRHSFSKVYALVSLGPSQRGTIHHMLWCDDERHNWPTQRIPNVIISLQHQNNVATSFWCNNDIITSCVSWASK